MLDADLADYYEVELKVLNQAVKRNGHLFPNDFMFKLNDVEWKLLRSQNQTLEGKGRYSKYAPNVFTEEGAWTVSFLLKQTADKGIQLIRALKELRNFALTQQTLPAPVATQLAASTSTLNIYNYGTVQVQNGSGNSQIAVGSLLVEIQSLKNQTDNEKMNQKLDDLMSAVTKKEDKSKVMTIVDGIVKISKTTKSLAEFGSVVAKLVSVYYGVGF